VGSWNGLTSIAIVNGPYLNMAGVKMPPLSASGRGVTAADKSAPTLARAPSPFAFAINGLYV
jgi:hypothetical protein